MSDPQAVPGAPQLEREIATTVDGRDITRGYLGPLLLPWDSILRARGNGDVLIYEAVLSEPQVAAALQQRRLALVNCEWQVDAASDKAVDKGAADFLRDQLHRVGWDAVTGLMHYGVFYGYAVAEVIYGREGRYVTLDAIKVRNRRRFRFTPKGELRLLTYQNMLTGEPCDAPYFWWFATGADNHDEPYGMGLAHWLYWPTLFKRQGVKFWMIFLEKFGMPTVLGFYDQAATPAEKQQLLAAAKAVQTDSGVIMPQGMMLQLLEATRGGTVNYETLIKTMDEAINKTIIGQSMTSESRGGQYKSEIQMEVRQDLIKADGDLICESFNLGPARWLTHWNFPNAQPPRVSRIVEQPEDMLRRAQQDQTVAAMGFKPSLSYIEEIYGGQWIEVAAAATPQAPPVSASQTSAMFAEGAPPDTPALQADQLARDAAPAVDHWIGRIRDLVQRAKRLEEVRDGLLALAPDMTLDDYASAMQQALAAAAAAGRYDIVQEAGGHA